MYCSRIISICMFRIPSFGDEVIGLLWDKSQLHPTHPQPTNQITISRDYAGSTCSLFGKNSFRSLGSDQDNSSLPAGDSNESIAEDSFASPVADHPSPATIGTFATCC